jgi:hypothetical protein
MSDGIGNILVFRDKRYAIRKEKASPLDCPGEVSYSGVDEGRVFAGRKIAR